MIVQVHNTESKLTEWCLLEFQGDIVGDLPGNELGKIEITKDVASMELGQHLLQGNVMKLKSSFIVLEKQNSSSSGSSSEAVNDPAVGKLNMEMDEHEGSNSEEKLEGNSMTVEGIVNTKIIFKTRPRPKPQKKVAK
jgi:hypothetical protein|tara:strand:- start:168 stop:578 length:411 start_codon:yes stop_codon:yes gene_type:complete